MKKYLLGLVAILLVFAMVSPVFASGSGESGSKSFSIGLSLPTQREARWVSDKNTMEAYAKQLGVDLKVAVADADTAQQASQVENLIAQGVKVLILAPNDAAAAASLVDKAEAEGIPVISYDRLITNTKNVDLYISFDNVKVGELQGEFITKLVPQGNYIIMSGAPTDNNAKLFKQGAMKYIQPLIDSGKIKVVADQAVDNWLPANALNIVENALTASNNKVDAILAPNDGTAGGAIVALEAQGLAGKVPITGQDSEAAAAKRIIAGTQSMTIFKDTRLLGKAAVDAAIAYAKGQTPVINNKVNNGVFDVPSNLLTPYVVTKDNLDKMLIDSGYLTHDQVYGQ
jgi:D-xylose transport system substrate-binding protein